MADLETTLLAEVGRGQAVAILPWHRGLVAVSADGQRQQTLVPGPIKFALVDHRARVVWFGRGSATATTDLDELLLLDLGTPTSGARVTPNPVLIATGLPGGCDFEVVYAAPGSSIAGETISLASRGDVATATITLDPTGAEPPAPGVRAPYRGDVDEMDAESSELARNVRVMPEADKVLRAIARRAAGRRALLARGDGEAPDERRVATVTDENCHNEGVCGTMRRVAGTKLALVTVQQWCPGHDGCQMTMQLFDPERGLFLALKRPGAVSRSPIDDEIGIGMETLWVSPDGRALVHEGAILVPGISRLDEPLDATTTHDPRGGGWLGGQGAAGVQL